MGKESERCLEKKTKDERKARNKSRDIECANDECDGEVGEC